MSAADPTARWQAGGYNNRWVFRLSDAGCRTFSRSALYTIADSVMEWYQGRRPDTFDALADNLSKAFPARSRREVEALASATLRNYAHGVVDYLRGARDPATVTAEAGADAMIASLTGGAILVTAHMGNWELGGTYLGRSVGPHWIVGFPERDAGVETFRRERRQASGHTTLNVGMGVEGMMGLRRALEAGGRMVVLVDRAIGRDAVGVTFMGRPANFLKSPAVFSLMTGAPIVPVAVMCTAPGRYESHVGEPYRTEECGSDPGAAMQRAADFFSRLLERYPDQWYNFFRYWREEP
jgi:lauroyl/myristoyl acyltransferase